MSRLGGLASCAMKPVPQASWSGWHQFGCLRMFRPLCCPSWHKDICLYVSGVPMLYNSDFLFGKTIFWRKRRGRCEMVHKRRVFEDSASRGTGGLRYAQIKIILDARAYHMRLLAGSRRGTPPCPL